ncbi:hypothetical protein AB6B38_13090 [Glycocaulis abyssi]|jgi:hypothetical protein|uniref:Uncharacterized protein n=2 Tax=Glycocaulis TaxID=1433402 RepID=A0ABQ1XY90_9PROT|nr:hypothetical protein [Glycocaulis albus]GGH06853.1 hypothetical protein GCM10007420_24380 [Glycocaulis albus]
MIEKKKTEARQGEPAPNHMTRHALVGGVVLAVIGIVIAYIVIF